MNAIELLKGICAECLDLDGCFVFNGDYLGDGNYARIFPLNRDSVLDIWFKKDCNYFCVYSEKDYEYTFLSEPALRAKSKAADDEVIDFWLITE